MNRKVLRGSPAFICALFVFCFGCSSPGIAGPAGPYNRIIIDTYNPTDPTGLLGPDASNYMELWNSDRSALIASDNGGLASSRPPSQLNQLFAYIDYNGVLASGDYWVLIQAASPGDSIHYAIRVLTAPNNSYSGWTFGSVASELTTDLPTTGGVIPTSGGTPTVFKPLVFSNTISDRLNRLIVPDALGVHAVNWMKLTLP